MTLEGSLIWGALLSIQQFVRGGVLLLLLTISSMAGAVYNNNLAGIPTTVAVYAEGDFIYLRLSNQPTSHPVCNPAYFVISEAIPENRRNQMLAALLAAKHSGEPINIGFDDSVECMHGFIRVHRVG